METKRRFFASPQDVEAAFYDALQRADLDAMMEIWAEDEEIVCVHPGGPRLSGFAVVQESWRQIFSGTQRLKIQLSHQVYVQGLLLSVHSVHENISIIGESAPPQAMVATNIYLRGAQGWRMLVHHSSPAPVATAAAGDSPKTLH
jgi:ketosteroid isomerase-like protein